MLRIGLNVKLHCCPCACLGPCDEAESASSGVTADNTTHTADETALTADDDASI